MKRLTNREILIWFLDEVKHYKRIANPMTSRYEVFESDKSTHDNPHYYFVGDSGALRCGHNVTSSYSLTDKVSLVKLRALYDSRHPVVEKAQAPSPKTTASPVDPFARPGGTPI